MTTEKKAYLLLKKQDPNSKLTRYAGLVWRVRRYTHSQDPRTKQVMKSLYRTLLQSPLHKNVLEVCA
jgi:hypothetical protein